MAERIGHDVRRSPRPDSDGRWLAAVLLAPPFALAAALAALIAGGGLFAALAAYGLAGAMALMAGAALIARPRRVELWSRGLRRVDFGVLWPRRVAR